MSISREQFNNAFREVIDAEFSDIPTDENSIQYTFSEKFEKKMKRLINAQRKPYYHLVNSTMKRMAVAAAVVIVIGGTIAGVMSLKENSHIHKEIISEKRVFLSFGSTESGGASMIAGDGELRQYGIDTRKIVKVLPDAKKEVDSIYNKGQKLQYAESECKVKNASDDELGSFYCIYDVYKGNGEEIKYLNGTDIMCYYSIEDEDNSLDYPTISGKELKRIADNFLKEFIPEDKLSEYEFSVVQGSYNWGYMLSYTRYVEGYHTDEIISICVDKAGKVTSYEAYNLCKYDSLTIEITKNELDKAKNALKKEVSAQHLLNPKMFSYNIITNTEGRLYMRAAVTYYVYNEENELYRELENVYISIN